MLSAPAPRVYNNRVYKRVPLADRVAAKIVKGDGCWSWTGTRNNQGYPTVEAPGRGGSISARVGPILVHRFMYEQANGPIPEGMLVCHRCDNPGCIRPDHLFLGTMKDNMADMKSKGRDAHWGWKRGRRK